MQCAIRSHLCNSQKVKNTHEGMLLFMTLQAKVCSFTKSKTLVFKFFKTIQMVPNKLDFVLTLASEKEINRDFGLIHSYRIVHLGNTMFL